MHHGDRLAANAGDHTGSPLPGVRRRLKRSLVVPTQQSAGSVGDPREVIVSHGNEVGRREVGTGNLPSRRVEHHPRCALAVAAEKRQEWIERELDKAGNFDDCWRVGV